MVFREAAKKTGAYMLISAVLSLGIVTFMTEQLATPSGRVVSPVQEIAGGSWLVFVLGLFIGGLMIGTYFYVAHIERKKML